MVGVDSHLAVNMERHNLAGEEELHTVLHKAAAAAAVNSLAGDTVAEVHRTVLAGMVVELGHILAEDWVLHIAAGGIDLAARRMTAAEVGTGWRKHRMLAVEGDTLLAKHRAAGHRAAEGILLLSAQYSRS
jgi:hypothetical protein